MIHFYRCTFTFPRCCAVYMFVHHSLHSNPIPRSMIQMLYSQSQMRPKSREDCRSIVACHNKRTGYTTISVLPTPSLCSMLSRLQPQWEIFLFQFRIFCISHKTNLLYQDHVSNEITVLLPRIRSGRASIHFPSSTSK